MAGASLESGQRLVEVDVFLEAHHLAVREREHVSRTVAGRTSRAQFAAGPDNTDDGVRGQRGYTVDLKVETGPQFADALEEFADAGFAAELPTMGQHERGGPLDIVGEDSENRSDVPLPNAS
jgi:hypothetical protein